VAASNARASDPEQLGNPLLHSLSHAELDAMMAGLGEPTYRAGQLWRWLYIQKAADWSEMLNLPRTLRETLAARFTLLSAEAAETQGPPDDTRKILVDLPDREQVECVLIPARHGRTVCLSSQAGCRFHCAFCASGQAGFRRNLETGEMIGQFLLAAREWGQAPTHVVFMGIGEPMDNYDNVLKAVRILNDPDGLNIGARRITISTCGVVPGIERLSGEGLQVELSVSLHAADNSLRDRLMPVNKRYPVEQLMAACAAYSEKTGRIVTFEYTLIHGINDTPDDAKALANLLRSRMARVNLIPLSPVEEFPHQPPVPEAAERFAAVLERTGINVTLRQSRGCSLQAGCGQLRYRKGPAS